MSVVKAFEILHCTSCMKERCLIIKEELNNNNNEDDCELSLLAEHDSNHIAANPVLVPTPTACKSKTKNGSDSPDWWEATTCSESEQFWTAMDKETHDLIKKKTW